MKTRRRRADLMFLSNSAQVVYQPKGVVVVIAAWNFPIIEAVGPLITALAAGNRVMIKMSEFSPRSTVVLRRMLAEIFAEDQVAVFGGGVEIGRAFAALPFDHIVFTGSPAVGREIMRAASAHLTPVTLELGGKSPAIVARSASMAVAAQSIAHGRPSTAIRPSRRTTRWCRVIASTSSSRRRWPRSGASIPIRCATRTTPAWRRTATRIALANCSPTRLQKGRPSPRAAPVMAGASSNCKS